MDARRPVSWLLALLLVAGGSLGMTECDPEGLLARIGHVLMDHDERLDELESCSCCCEGVLAPVCGDDARTYVNACEARCAGVEPVARGECEKIECGGPEGIACEDGQFCEQPAGCDALSAGMCEEIPDACPDVWAPVCGCDGQTYGNDCERRAAGVPLDRRGECETAPTRCRSNEQCLDDEFCFKRVGVCEDGGGICRPRPDACPRIFDPVCGCDGRTYANACEAAAAGVAPAAPGRCEPTPVACLDNAQCADDEFCFKRMRPPYEECDDDWDDSADDDEHCRPHADSCEDVGVCRSLPEACPDVWDPVCGCDDTTYGNACEAAAAGVSVAFEGPCPRLVCHRPPGNPSNERTIRVGELAVRAHLGHGDYLGRCRDR